MPIDEGSPLREDLEEARPHREARYLDMYTDKDGMVVIRGRLRPEVKWELFPFGGATVRRPRELSRCKAMEIFLTGDKMDAGEAHRIGLVNYVVPPEELMPTA